MTDYDRFDADLVRFLTAEARRADAYRSIDRMIDIVSPRASRRFASPSRALVFALLAMALLTALVLSFIAIGSKRPVSVVLPSPTLTTVADPGLLAYAKDGELHLFDADTESDRVIYREDGIESSPLRWSLDGSRIMFGEASSIAADATDLKTVTSGLRGTWSRDAKFFAYYDDNNHIVIRNAANDVVKSVDVPGGYRYLDWMDWTADGQAVWVSLWACTPDDCPDQIGIGFPHTVSAGQTEALWLVAVGAGSPYRLVESAPGSALLSQAAAMTLADDWVPDRSLVAVGHSGSCVAEICDQSIDVVDGATGTVVSNIPDAQFLNWSPDGSRMAIAMPPALGATYDEVGTVRVDGSERTVITLDGGGLVWSADGQRIAYGVGTDATDGDVHIVNADGTDDHVAFSGTNNFDWQHFAPRPTP